MNTVRNRVHDMLTTLKSERPDLIQSLTEDTWGYDRTWMVGKVRNTEEIGLPVITWTQKYLTSLSLGPWRVPQQVHQKNLLLHKVQDLEFTALSGDIVANLQFRLSWQRNQATTLHSTLNHLNIKFDDLCEQLSQLNGQIALDLLSRLSGVKSYSKCLDFFVREALCLDALPIDRHVRRFLERIGLQHASQEEVIAAIRDEGFDPRLVARTLYEQGGQAAKQ